VQALRDETAAEPMRDLADDLRECARDAAVASARLLAAVVVVADGAKPGFGADEVAFALTWTQSAARLPSRRPAYWSGHHQPATPTGGIPTRRDGRPPDHGARPVAS
jgi:hypothetical protein